MKHEIEDYKGHTIYYDEFYDVFRCEISAEDRTKSTKRNKLDDVRKEIDKFVRDNLDFKPFKVIGTSSMYDVKPSESRTYIVSAIRTDGTLVVAPETGGSKSYMLPEKVEKNFRHYDPEFDQIREYYDTKLKELRSEQLDKLTEKYNSLKPLNLSKYKL